MSSDSDHEVVEYVCDHCGCDFQTMSRLNTHTNIVLKWPGSLSLSPMAPL